VNHVDSTEVPDFDDLYRSDPDPWEVGSSWYERRKLALLMASLPYECYPRAWEPGCGIGVSTAALAERVTVSMSASDASPVAVDLARQRCADLSHVTVRQSRLPEVPLDAPVDLVVVAEFLYYVPDLQSALDALWSATKSGAHLVFMHWAHQPEDAYRSGPEMHAAVAADASHRRAVRLVTHAETDFQLDIYEAT